MVGATPSEPDPQTLEGFYALLAGTAAGVPLGDFCRKHVLHGTPFVFRGKEPHYYDFRKRIADKFGVSYAEVLITGSAKMGFSPHKNTVFSADSDIDVAIVSSELYEKYVEIAREYQMQLRAARRAVTVDELRMYHQYLEYLVLGWIRPDRLPLSFRVNDLKTDWFEFFASISNGRSEVGNYKVAAGVFRSHRHLELYTFSSIQSVQERVMMNQRQNTQ